MTALSNAWVNSRTKSVLRVIETAWEASRTHSVLVAAKATWDASLTSDVVAWLLFAEPPDR